MTRSRETFSCPNCGGEVRTGRKACPHCGSDETTGWSDRTYLDGLGMYDEDDYRETIEREFGTGTKKPGWKQVVTWFAAGLMLFLFLKFFILQC